jgi:archaemetzincin
MSPKAKRRIVLFAAGLSAGALLAVFAVVLPARNSLRPVPPCRECGPDGRKLPDPVPLAGQEKLGPPGQIEWRARVHEDPQSFEAYVASNPNRKCAHRAGFYIQPLTTPPERRSFAPGAHERFERAIGLMREYAEIYFNLPVRVLPEIPIFESAYDSERSQSHATEVIALLAERIPKDALVLIGLTEDDLYSKGLNFVFGEGSLNERTGVYSLRRFQTQDEPLFLRRSLNLMAHEVGHILSIHHCVTWRCVMQGANTLLEHDSHPMSLCPEDLRKLEWNTGFDRMERYRKLRDFYRRVGLGSDAAWVEARLSP